jgi:hypothetical protein
MRTATNSHEEPDFDWGPASQAAASWSDDEITDVHDKPIGSILTETNRLGAGQVQKVLDYQRKKGVRFVFAKWKGVTKKKLRTKRKQKVPIGATPVTLKAVYRRAPRR